MSTQTQDGRPAGPQAEALRIKRAYRMNCEPSHGTILLQETGRLRYRILGQALRDLGPTSVLDLGCGGGNLEREMFVDGLALDRIVGCDLSRSKLMDAVRSLESDSRVQLVEADAEALPFRSRSFDTVVATEVIEHVPSDAKCLDELERLSPQTLLITVPALRYPPFLMAIGSERFDGWATDASNRFRRGRGFAKAFSILIRVVASPVWLVAGILRTRSLPYYDYLIYHGNVPHRLYTAGHVVAALEDRGFRVDVLRGVGFAPPFVPEFEVACRRLGLTAVADFLAKVQGLLEDRFLREPDRSQNIFILCTRILGTAHDATLLRSARHPWPSDRLR